MTFLKWLFYGICGVFILAFWIVMLPLIIPLVIVLLPFNLIGELSNKTVLKNTRYHYD